MTLRSLVLGALLGLLVPSITGFNDQVIRQTFLSGSLLPILVLGILLLLLLIVNPVLFRIRASLALRPAELAVVAALGFASCGWAGTSFLRHFSAVVSRPGQLYDAQTDWTAAHVMSYVPGGSPEFAEGHIRNWRALVDSLDAASRGGASPTMGRVWSLLSAEARRAVELSKDQQEMGQDEKAAVLRGLNADLSRPDLVGDGDAEAKPAGVRDIQSRNRRALVQSYPALFLPAPRGSGILLDGGQKATPAGVAISQGRSGGQGSVPLAELWSAWWPTLRYWGGLTLLLGIASFCMVIIFVPQWKRELLPFPVARFVKEIVDRDAGRPLPAVVYSKLFWYAVGAMVFVHAVRGIKAWYPQFVDIPLSFDFTSVKTIAPTFFANFNATITVLPTLAAFSYFLNTSVSFSLGIAQAVYALFMTAIAAYGVQTGGGFLEPGHHDSLRFGAYVGALLTVVYVGRSYYAAVVARSLGFGRNRGIPAAAAWSFRVFCLSVAAALWLLTVNGLDWIMATVAVGGVLLTFVVVARINAETGSFYNQSIWLPACMGVVVLGEQAIGPTAYLVVYMISLMYTADIRENVMPFLMNGVTMASDEGTHLPRTGGLLWIGIIMVAGLAVAFGATLAVQNTYGLNTADAWAVRDMPRWAFERTTVLAGQLGSFGELSAATEVSGLDRLAYIKPSWGLASWMALGLGAVIICQGLRLRYAWWPLHPVLFLVWGTDATDKFFFGSIFLGWVVKSLVVRFSGARGYQSVKPFMIGIVAGEVLMGLFWIAVGAVYFFVTGKTPATYAVFPI